MCWALQLTDRFTESVLENIPNWIISVKYSLLVPLEQGCAAIFSISDRDADDFTLVSDWLGVSLGSLGSLQTVEPGAGAPSMYSTAAFAWCCSFDTFRTKKNWLVTQKM